MRMISLAQEIKDKGNWFQNIIFPSGEETNPGNHYPRCLWREVKPFLPTDLTGQHALVIGCNGGFETIELHKLGPRSITAIDYNHTYTEQTELVKREFMLDELTVLRQDIENDFAEPPFDKKYDLVLMLGVIYHVENPIKALINTIALTKTLCILETDIAPGEESMAEFFNYPEHYKYTFRPTHNCMVKWIEYAGGTVLGYKVRENSPRRIYTIAPTGTIGIKRI